jgi:hypothetical protein
MSKLYVRLYSGLRNRHALFLNKVSGHGVNGNISFKYLPSHEIGIIHISNPNYSNAMSGNMMVRYLLSNDI